MAGTSPSHQIPYPTRPDPFELTRDIKLAIDKIDMLLAQGLNESGAALTSAEEALLIAQRAELVATQKSSGVHIGPTPPESPMLWLKTDAQPSRLPVTSADITDATEVGRAVLTAPWSADARNALSIFTGTRALLDAGTDTAERTWDAKELHEYVTETAASAGGAASWDDLTGKPTTFPPSAHTHDDRYYTRAEVDQAIADATRVEVVDARPWFVATHTWHSATKLVTSGSAMQLTISGRATGGAISNGTVVATIPAEYRPRAEVYGTGQNFGAGVATAMTNGQITFPSVADAAYFKTTFSWVR